MDFATYQTQFTQQATSVGYTQQNIQKCLDYAAMLFEKKLPVVYNTAHFAALVGYNKDYIKRAVTFTPKFYRDFDILKKNGGQRKISEPLPSLKDIQLWMLENILNKVKVSPYAKAYVHGISLKQNLVFHKGEPKVFKIDVENFFGSIDQVAVETMFSEMGYSKILANLFSKLCTKDHCLPQGAPTSPYLSNIYFKIADENIASFCRKRGIKYTRYADDLTFSGDFDEEELKTTVCLLLEGLKLKINSSKTKLMKQGQQQKVTGVVVNEKLQVSFKQRNQLRSTMYYIRKFGLEDHKKRLNITKANYLDHLLGKVNFVLYLNAEDKEFLEYKKYLNALKGGTHLKIS